MNRDEARAGINKYRQIVDEKGKPFRDKVDENRARGAAALVSGIIDPFTGYKEKEFRERLTCVLDLDLESQEAVQTEAVTPLKTAAEKHGVHAVYPNAGDLPPHIALQLLLTNNISPDEQQRLLTRLEGDGYMATIGAMLTGIELPLDTLVLSGRDTYICAGDFSMPLYPILMARLVMRKAHKDAAEKEGIPLNEAPSLNGGIELVDYSRLLHLTSMREIEPIAPQETRKAFASDVQQGVQRQLREAPILVRTSGFYFGTSQGYADLHGIPTR